MHAMVRGGFYILTLPPAEYGSYSDFLRLIPHTELPIY